MPIHGYPGNVITANPTAPTSSVATGVWTTEQQLQAVSQGNWPGYEYPISRSLRLNSADSANLTRTFSAGSQTTWTLSMWFKRGAFNAAAARDLFTVNNGTSDSIYFVIAIRETDKLRIEGFNTNFRETTQVLRDVSAWYHLVVTVDTNNATAANRIRMYLNGVEITAFSVSNNPSLGQSLGVNQAATHKIGALTSTYFDGYMTEINFIAGQALTPSSFGLNDPETGVWSPKAYTGSYSGTNSFYINFSDNSNTTAATLGKDYSGNGNNWTPNNFSVTAGAGNDSLVDSPTSYGTDTGVGGTVRGNYATFNALQLGSSTTLNNGNLDSAATASSFNTVSGTMFVSSGKWYAEVTILDVSADYSTKRVGVGIIKDTGTEQSSYLGSSTSGYAYYANATKYNNATSGSYGASYVTNDVIGIAMDLDAGTLVFYKNNTSQGTAYSGLSGAFSFATSHYGSGAKVAINFGQRAFAYTAPSGFKALCTQNLPTPTIGATSTTQANKYIDVITRNGLAPSGSFSTSIQLATDGGLIWQKVRNAADNHYLIDTVRGISKTLFSNSTNAEGTDANFITAVANGSVTMGSNDWISSQTVVGWLWGAGGTGVSNTAGTITSTVSANTTSGFSIISYTGNKTSGATIGHGLGVAPAMVIFKERANVSEWIIYHQSLGATQSIYFSTAAANTNSIWFNNTAPSSTVITLGNADGTNRANTMIAYAFAPVAGYSAFGSYTGNGSGDGPFVYTGFRPRYILWKVSSGTTGHWEVVDTARETYNQSDQVLFASSSGAESAASSSYYMDILSNGFKIRNTDTSQNGNTYTYIYAAFAETPFKYSLAR